MKGVITALKHKIYDWTGVTERRRYQQALDTVTQGIDYTGRDLYANLSGNILFVHIPKCAGMSFVKAIYGNSTSQHAKAIDYQKCDPARYERMFSFAVSRDPYARLYSAFCYLKGGGQATIDKVWKDLYVGMYKDVNDFIQHGLHKAVNENAVHFIPQFKFVFNEESEMLCDYIGKIEKLDEVMDTLRKQGLHGDLTTENTSSSNRKEQPDFSKVYSPESLTIINQVYDKDFVVFDYEKIPG